MYIPKSCKAQTVITMSCVISEAVGRTHLLRCQEGPFPVPFIVERFRLEYVLPATFDNYI